MGRIRSGPHGARAFHVRVLLVCRSWGRVQYTRGRQSRKALKRSGSGSGTPASRSSADSLPSGRGAPAAGMPQRTTGGPQSRAGAAGLSAVRRCAYICLQRQMSPCESNVGGLRGARHAHRRHAARGSPLQARAPAVAQRAWAQGRARQKGPHVCLSVPRQRSARVVLLRGRQSRCLGRRAGRGIAACAHARRQRTNDSDFRWLRQGPGAG